jgi:hypothetical protein
LRGGWFGGGVGRFDNDCGQFELLARRRRPEGKSRRLEGRRELQGGLRGGGCNEGGQIREEGAAVGRQRDEGVLVCGTVVSEGEGPHGSKTEQG